MENRAEGDGGCGACALCCKEMHDRAYAAELALALAQKLLKQLEKDRDEARGYLEVAENQLVRCNAVLIIAREGIRMNLVKVNPTSESALKMSFDKIDAVIKEQKL